MESLRKWFYKPKRDDRSLLAQFFFADEALNMVAAELDSFDGRKDPERCSTLVNQLRLAQDRVLNITSQIMDQLLGDERVARGFRVKFPEDVLQDNLAGQLWFGAECLAAGSSIMNRELESAAMRPLAKALTRSLETVRSLLREHCLRPRPLALSVHDDMLLESLKIFDRLFAEFELCYVSVMVNVKSPHEFEVQQLICVLFSETLQRSLKIGLLTQEQVDAYDPALMFAVPRLAIVSGLLIYSSGPLCIDKPPDQMSDMFRPFRTLLHKIRELLWTLDRRELLAVERLLCTNEDISNIASVDLPSTGADGEKASCQYPDIGEFVNRFYADHAHCRDVYTTQLSATGEQTITEGDYLPDNVEVLTPILDGMRRLNHDDGAPDCHPGETTPVSAASTTRQNSESSDHTFQTNEHKPRKTSKAESTDLSALRNLSTNGLMMFDPLVINAVSNSSQVESNRLIPDQSLVTSLNEQVTEIADKLSSIVSSDTTETMTDHGQIHSYSTNDVPNLIATECLQYPTNEFMHTRNEQLLNLPSTSHGYLIPNAISQEPAVLASLSHNNSAIFSETDEDGNRITEVGIATGQMIIPENQDAMTSSILFANANLSSLLLTNEEFRDRFLCEQENSPASCDSDNNSFYSAVEVDNSDKVKFTVGYESDTQEPSPGDSGVSTENTSLDRSPDSDLSKELREKKLDSFMKQNRVLESTERTSQDDKERGSLESSFSECIASRNAETSEGDVTVDINYVDSSEHSKNEAGSSGNAQTRESIENLDEMIADLCKQNERTESNVQTNAAAPQPRKKKAKSKRKKSRMWSPGNVILENISAQQYCCPMTLNLEQLVEGDVEAVGASVAEVGLAAAGCAAECADDEEIALALQAQELAARQATRAKFRSSEDLIHRLFVCIAGVADQLQTNFAADLRNILKSVFLINQTPEKPETPEPEPEPVLEAPETSEHRKHDQTIEYEATEVQVIQNGSSFDSVYSAEEVYADSSDSANSENSSDSAGSKLVRRNTVNVASLSNRIESELIDHPTTSNEETLVRKKSADGSGNNLQSSASTGDLTEAYRTSVLENDGGNQTETVERAPEWIPDIAAPDCMRCSAHFTAFRRRHHCRNCGKVFCASCSSNSIPLPRYGQVKPVRVCEECFRSIAKHCRRTHNPQQACRPPVVTAPPQQYRA